MCALQANTATLSAVHNTRPLRIAAILLTGLLSACSVVRAPEPISRSTEGDRIAALATDQVGAPYRFGGATPQGFDCSGLVRFVFEQSGKLVPRTASEQVRSAEPVPLDNLQPGDLVFFKIAAERVDHVGIYVGAGAFVHAPRTGRPVSRDLLADNYYQRRYAGAGRFWR